MVLVGKVVLTDQVVVNHRVDESADVGLSSLKNTAHEVPHQDRCTYPRNSCRRDQTCEDSCRTIVVLAVGIDDMFNSEPELTVDSRIVLQDERL